MFKSFFNKIGECFRQFYIRTTGFFTDIWKALCDRINDAKRAYRFTINTLKSERGVSILLSTIKDGAVKFFKALWKETKNILANIRDNWEAAMLLTFSLFGLTHLIGKIPLTITLPTFFEAAMVIPAVAMIIIMLLIVLMQAKVGEPCEV